jgi:hypothetical protein
LAAPGVVTRIGTVLLAPDANSQRTRRWEQRPGF